MRKNGYIQSWVVLFQEDLVRFLVGPSFHHGGDGPIGCYTHKQCLAAEQKLVFLCKGGLNAGNVPGSRVLGGRMIFTGLGCHQSMDTAGLAQTVSTNILYTGLM